MICDRMARVDNLKKFVILAIFFCMGRKAHQRRRCANKKSCRLFVINYVYLEAECLWVKMAANEEVFNGSENCASVRQALVSLLLLFNF